MTEGKNKIGRTDWKIKISMIGKLFFFGDKRFLEIYNESVYDLLNVENEGKSFSDWDRLDFFEAEDGSTEVKN